MDDKYQDFQSTVAGLAARKTFRENMFNQEARRKRQIQDLGRKQYRVQAGGEGLASSPGFMSTRTPFVWTLANDADLTAAMCFVAT